MGAWMTAAMGSSRLHVDRGHQANGQGVKLRSIMTSELFRSSTNSSISTAIFAETKPAKIQSAISPEAFFTRVNTKNREREVTRKELLDELNLSSSDRKLEEKLAILVNSDIIEQGATN